MSINSVFGLLGGAIAFLVGWVAARLGLQAAMWILLAGPVSLVLFVPRSIAAKNHANNRLQDG